MNAVRNGSGFTLPVSRNPDKSTWTVALPETGRETDPLKKQNLKKARTLGMRSKFLKMKSSKKKSDLVGLR